MAEADIESVAYEPRELALDPFGFHVGVASRVEGLGGNAPGHDHSYVFHTPYVEAAEGPCRFHLHFHNLRATRGSLVLRVHMLPLEEGAHARVANSERIALFKLIRRDNRIAVTFEGFRGFAFALDGAISDETDAAADGLTITLDRPADPNEAPRAPVRATSYGRDAVKPTPRLLDLERPTLANPVSQLATRAQLKEPAGVDGLARLRGERQSERAAWCDIFILQALRRYGMAEAGARGLGLGAENSVLPALMAAAGTDVVATYAGNDDPEGATAMAASLRRPALCDQATFDARVTMRAAELYPVPLDLEEFDFLWSSGVCERLGPVALGLRFIHDAMRCLRPGGMAVHCFAYDPFTRDMRASEADAPIFQRRHLERLALNLISRGHEVAQMKVDATGVLLDRVELPGWSGGYDIAAFGIIIRKARIAH